MVVQCRNMTQWSANFEFFTKRRYDTVSWIVLLDLILSLLTPEDSLSNAKMDISLGYPFNKELIKVGDKVNGHAALTQEKENT